jgi:hypothetical protein
LTPSLEIELFSLGDLEAFDGAIITHSFHYLVEWFRRDRRQLPSTIVDLESAERLCQGYRKSALRRPYPWQIGPIILRRLGTDLPGCVARGLADCQLEPIVAGLAREDSSSPYALRELLQFLPLVWRELRSELKEKGEWSRFIEIEMPAYNLLLGIQYKGIGLDVGLCRDTVTRIEDQYFSLHRQLTVGKGVDVERAFGDGAYLRGLLGQKAQRPQVLVSPIDELRARRGISQLCSDLYRAYRLRQDRRILMGAISDGLDRPRAHIQFDTMGTVTARVLAAAD